MSAFGGLLMSRPVALKIPTKTFSPNDNIEVVAPFTTNSKDVKPNHLNVDLQIGDRGEVVAVEKNGYAKIHFLYDRINYHFVSPANFDKLVLKEKETGGADAAAGGGCVEQRGAFGGVLGAKQPVVLRMPPQPSLPTRLPRRSRGIESSASSSCPSSSSFSPPGTPATLSPESLKTSVMKATPPALSLGSMMARTPPAPTSCPQEKDAWWGLDIAEIPRAHSSASVSSADPLDGKAKKAPESEESTGGDFCCFREGRMLTSRSRRSRCESIKEDRPQTKFDFDVMVLELRSLLRSHAIEPSDALMGDLLVWQARAAERSYQPGRPPLHASRH